MLLYLTVLLYYPAFCAKKKKYVCFDRSFPLYLITHIESKNTKQNSILVFQVTEGHKVSFPYFMAFTSLLNNMELIKRIYLHATQGNRTEPVTKDELLFAAQTMSQITPLEIDILFQLTGALQQSG